MLEKGTIVFGNWTVEETIGSGAFGTVYKIKREEFGKVFYAAVKVLQIPQDKEEYRRLKSEGMDDASISNYYSQIAQDFLREIEFLSSLDGITNIVDYKDHIIEPNENMGYTIYIKMQMLTPLAKALLDKDGSARFMEADEVVKLGKDMCSALEVCEKRNIIHRDIKIDNIFISENGYYKLGDFGIAKQLEATHGEMSKKGTMLYMAPEVFRGENYDKTVDIYSLGIVLYRLLNKNRAPFFPNYPDPIKFSDKEIANAKRLKGEVLPDIVGVGAELNAVLTKACAFNPRDRYQSASEFKAALEKVSVTPVAPVETAPAVKISSDDEATVGAFSTVPVVNSSSDDEVTVGAFSTVPVVNSSSDDEATVGVFSTVPAVKSSSDDEATVGAFGGVPVAPVASVPGIENDIDDEKTESVFTPAFAEEKTESVFTPAVQSILVNDEKKVDNVESAKENKKKKSKIAKVIIAIVLVLAILGGTLAVLWKTGAFSNDYNNNYYYGPYLNSDGYYEICTAEELLWFADEVNSGRNPSANAILMSDIDLNPGYVFNSDGTVTYDGSYVTEGWTHWEPIGWERSNGGIHYSGTFDGNGHWVTGVYFNDNGRYAVGFFGYTENATIKNLTVSNAYINGYASVGGIVGYNLYSTIDNCCFSGSLYSGNNYAGGIVGYDSCGEISNCVNFDGTNGYCYVGGIVGYAYKSTIDDCDNGGSVAGVGNVGGIVGHGYYGDVTNCINSGSVDATYNVGGVIGFIYETSINACSFEFYTAKSGVGYCWDHSLYHCESHGIVENY